MGQWYHVNLTMVTLGAQMMGEAWALVTPVLPFSWGLYTNNSVALV